jgi:excinuclease UvrABC ATPase subunit
MLWPLPVRELLQAIHQSGFKISFVENMFLQQELTAKLVVKQPNSTNTELVDAINETRTATIAAAMENVLQKCMDRLKINLDQAKERLIFQEHMHEPDGNIFFVLWDKETNQEVSKRIYYKELLNPK